MANGRNKITKGHDAGRDQGGFVAMPWAVMDSAAYKGLSHPARSLLWDLARQFVRDNNGRLLASYAFLRGRGWSSADTITRAKRELLAAGLIYETVLGHRPNKASWYAVTWRALDRMPGFDAGALEGFERGAYKKNAGLKPSGGLGKPGIGPAGGAAPMVPRPSGGPMKTHKPNLPRPGDGNHLETPSDIKREGCAGTVAADMRMAECPGPVHRARRVSRE